MPIRNWEPHPFKRCSVRGCGEMSVANRLAHGYCRHHYEKGVDSHSGMDQKQKSRRTKRGRCEEMVKGPTRRQMCGKVCAPPYSAKRCEEHHPKNAATALDVQVCDAIAKGSDPVTAIEKATGFTRSRSAQRLEKMSRKPGFQSLVTEALEKAGITRERFAKRLSDMFDAEKVAMTKDGEVVAMGLDNATVIKALDMYAKLNGSYAPKQVQQETEHKQLNVTIGLPAPEPPRPDTKVITIKAPKDG